MKIAIYIIGIILANVLTSQFAPFHLFGFLVPMGTFLIGFTFVMRDVVQMQHGKKRTYLIIGGALVLSAISTYLMGNGFRIVLASALSFLFSETLDTEVFTRLKGSIAKKVGISGVIGSILDSLLFTIAAGFPMNAAVGQMVFKIIMQGLGTLMFLKHRSTALPNEVAAV